MSAPLSAPRVRRAAAADIHGDLAEAIASPLARLGYVISRDRYLKRDDLGVVYQLCAKAGDQRKLVGATLVHGVFNRSAYGCKLYCCWCAQDLPANRFWESMAFVPVAFRAGSTGKRRVHILWQRELRDRYLEQVNDRLLLAPSGKYDVSRALQSAPRNLQSAFPALPEAA